jgi:hypothetical protein
MVFEAKAGVAGMEAAIAEKFARADAAIASGTNLIILSDRGIDPDPSPIPALLAVSGLHHHLIRNGTRTRVGLVLESGEPREVHHLRGADWLRLRRDQSLPGLSKPLRT